MTFHLPHTVQAVMQSKDSDLLTELQHILGVQASNNREIGIAQNKCNGNSITGNTATSNHLEGITADNQSQGGQVCQASCLTLTAPQLPMVSFCKVSTP